ncbi:Hypothetical protein Tpal_2648 [Trichococcus palustris]|uniref:Uncharacterized protein n=1 Tax=Trichococcus palustris TaxID=140314 RepID=A0A143Z0N9_9LACT|nr:Hypothetical protein Tpal_2648 [Trichococcus palustris]
MILIAILPIIPAVIILAYAGICMIHDSAKADA